MNKAYLRALQIMFSEKSVATGMCELDAYVRELIPHPFWNILTAIEFDSELQQIVDWLKNELESHLESEDRISILFFCLTDMGDALSLNGLKQNRVPNNDRDWGAYDHQYWSDAPSKVLQQFYDLAERELSDAKGGYTEHDVRWIVETCYPLVYSGLLIAEVMRRLPIKLLIGRDEKRRIAIFFGEGDDFFFGEITESGFKQYDLPNILRVDF